MKTAKDYRDMAWESMSGKWLDGVVVALVYILIAGCCGGGNAIASFVGGDILAESSSALTNLISIFVLGPMAAAITMLFLDFVRGEGRLELTPIFRYFRTDYSRILLATVVISVLCFLGIFTLGILSVYFSLAYAMTYFILRDYPQLTWREAMQTSREMMYGHKWDYFCLELSFIGWVLVCILTCGIGFLWLIPYTEAAKAHFYNELKAETIVEEEDGIQEAEVVE